MKKIPFIFLGIIVLLAGSILVVPSFIDWSKYRVEISTQVKQAIDRDLLIAGEIKFSLLPSPVLSVSDIRLTNASTGFNPDMVAMRQLDVEVALLPLLTGTINVQSIRLIEPKIYLEILTNGQGNWVFSSKTPDTAPQNFSAGNTTSSTVNASQGNDLPIQIDQFTIEKGEVFFIDQTSGREETVSAINAQFSFAGLSGPFEAAGTLMYKNIPLGFEGNVGQIVNNRSASFAGLLKTAHGKSETRFSGTFINQAEGPRINTKITTKGESFAGLLSAFTDPESLPKALDQTFEVETNLNIQPRAIFFGENGLDFRLGEDQLNIQLESELGETQNFDIRTTIKTINADRWLEGGTYEAKPLEVLEPVIQLSEIDDTTSGGRVSTSLAAPMRKPEETDVNEPDEVEPFEIPSDISAQISLDVDAILLKGDSVRQIKTNLSLEGGEIALERFSAVLPGAGDISIFGVAGAGESGFGFDGSLDVNFALVRNAFKWAGLDLSNIPNDRLQQLTLKSDIIADQTGVQLQNLSTKMDASTLEGSLGIAFLETPKVIVNLALDRLNLDAYLDKKTTQTNASATPTNTAQASAEDKALETKSDQAKAPDINLDFLNDLNADVNVKAASLRYQGEDVKGITLDAQVQNGTLQFNGTNIQDLAGLKIALTGGLKPESGSIVFEDLSLNVKGRSVGGALRLAQLQEQINAAKLGAVDLDASLNGPMLKPELSLSIQVPGSNLSSLSKIDLFPSPRIMSDIKLNSNDLGTLIGAFVKDYRPQGRINMNTSFEINASNNRSMIENISARINGTNVTGRILANMVSGTNLDINVRTGVLDVTPFMPAEKAEAQNTASSSNQVKSTKADPAQTSNSRWSREPIVVSGLDGVGVTFDLDSEAIKFKEIVANGVIVNARLKDNRIIIDQKISKLFGGPVDVQSQIETKPELNITSSLKTGTLDVATALNQTKSDTKASGKFTATSEIKTQGASEFDLVSNLNGQITSELSKINVGETSQGSPLQIVKLLSGLSGRSVADGLADITLNSTIEKGVARLTTADLSSAIANGAANGQVDLPNWTMDIAGTVKVTQNALVGLLAQKTNLKPEYPFSLRGSIDEPTRKLDIGGLGSGKGLVIPVPEKLNREGIGNLLQGIIGGAVGSQPPQAEEVSPSSNDERIAPPPPPPGSNSTNSKPPSVEEQLLRGLGTILQNR